jgi:hypothetical protein
MRLMTSRGAATLLLAAFVLAGCTRKPPAAPPQFADPNRAPTGSQALEDRVIRGINLSQMTDDEYRVLTEAATSEMASGQVLADFEAASAARGQLPTAINVLYKRALDAAQDQDKAADALGFAMGHLKWDACNQIAEAILSEHHSSGVFLVRALCLERLGRTEESKLNLAAASEVLTIEPEILLELAGLVEKRGSPGLMQPAPVETYDRLMKEFTRRGACDRLMLQHLLGHFHSQIQIGSVDVGGVDRREIRQIILSRSQSYRHCFHLADNADRKAPRLHGQADVRFVVGALGGVGGVTWTRSEWNDHPAQAQVETCLADQLRRLRFPQPMWGRQKLAVHRYSFQPD